MNQTLSIVHVVRQYLPNRGGLEDVVHNLARHSLARGHDVRVVTLDRLFTRPDHVLPSDETFDGIPVHRIPWRGSSRYPVAPSVFGALGKADLVHVHAVDFFYDALAFGKLVHRKPTIATTHGGFFHTEALSTFKTIWFNTTTRISSHLHDRVIACSRSDFERFSEVTGKNLVLIENGADIDKFADTASRFPVRRLVTIGRFSANKRLDRLVRMMSEPELQGFRLDIVGVPSDLSVDDVRALARQAGVEASVTVHPDLPVPAIAELFSACSFFVSASDYEGFGLVAIEAMSAGLVPVLNANEAYRRLADGNLDIILGDFSDPRDAALSVAKAWHRLNADPDQMRWRLRQSARAYSWEGVSERYHRIYHDVVAPGA